MTSGTADARIVRLLISCPDRHGIVAAVSQFLFEEGANILEADQHSTEPEGGEFFMRMAFRLEPLQEPGGRRLGFAERFAERVAGPFAMNWRFAYPDDPKRIAILASREDHCLLDLLHHSFLPAFAGADPYGRAHERGVKVIGATAHYVAEELDAGPIIEQDVARVSHRQNVDDLAAIGRDIERIVLARAVRWHLQDRIIVHENRTVVF
jgi:formyltetrahydrofolate hydrolase